MGENGRLDPDAIRARCEAATPGLWHVRMFRRDGYCAAVDAAKPWEPGGTQTIGHFERDEDAEFVVHAREDIPALFDSLRAVVEELRRLDATTDAIPCACNARGAYRKAAELVESLIPSKAS